jgi:hypothetical protein
MISTMDQHVLDAVAHSLEFEVFSISSATSREVVYGITWNTLQRITGLTEDALEESTRRLVAAGLIDCGGTPYSIFGWRLGRRSSAFFWATTQARRLIAEHDRCIDEGGVCRSVAKPMLFAGAAGPEGASRPQILR